jgi:hypothetical protein
METTVFPLQNAYNKYCKGLIEKRELESIIIAFVVKNPHRFCLNRWNQDEFFDYLCWVYPRIGKSIERYKDQGSTFDAYIGSVIRQSFKEFCFTMRDGMAIEHSWWNAHAENLYAAEDEAEYIAYDKKYPIDIPAKNNRQILFLLLKCYYFLSDDFIERIAPALDIAKEDLLILINALHHLRKHQEDEIKLLRERINSQYYRCICFESRMRASPEGSAHHAKMKRYLEKGRTRLHSMRKHLSSMRLNASNKQIAELLGIPKGTIDSSIYALKGKGKID